MTPKQIQDIASERVFNTETAPGHGNVMLQADLVWFAQEIEKAIRAEMEGER